MYRLLMIALMSLALGACQTTVTEKEFVTVEVAVRAPCPDDETLATLREALPVPLRDQEQPADAEARRAVERRQLGRYEAPGAFADKAMAVVTSCKSRQTLDPPP